MSNIIFSTSLIAATILVSFFYIAPEYSELKDKKDERTEYLVSIDQIESVQKKFAEAREWRSNIKQNDIERINTLLPQQFNNVKFLLDLDNIAVSKGVNVGLVKVDTDESEKDYSVHNISFSFDAPFGGNADQFLSDLESSLVIFDIVSLKMSVVTLDVEEGKEAIDLIRYSLSFNTYSQ